MARECHPQDAPRGQGCELGWVTASHGFVPISCRVVTNPLRLVFRRTNVSDWRSLGSPDPKSRSPLSATYYGGCE